MTASLTLAHGDFGVAVHCADASHLHWLEEMLAPWFVRADDRAPACRVELSIDAAAFADTVRRRPAVTGQTVAFVFDRGPVELPCWQEGAEQVLLDDADRIVYRAALDRRRFTVLANDAALTRRIRLMRVVRELAMSHAVTSGAEILHAAALALDGDGIVIAGAKHAGKTTLLWHALAAPGAELIANDRVVLDGRDGLLRARGMPSVVSVRAPTLRLFPELEQAWRTRRYAARRRMAEPDPFGTGTPPRLDYLTPAQFAALRGVGTRREAPLRAIVFLRRVPGAPPIGLCALPPAEAGERLTASVFAAHSTPRASEVFVPPDESGGGLAQRTGLAAAQPSRPAAAIPCLECVVGDWHREPPPPLHALLRRHLHPS